MRFWTPPLSYWKAHYRCLVTAAITGQTFNSSTVS